jgi:hypothetical protein
MIPGDVRLSAELKMRSRKRFASAPQFLRQLAQLIHRRVDSRRGRPSRLTRQYLRAVAANWLDLKLKIGRARGDESASVFQQFCEAALIAVGDRTKITSRDIKWLKETLGL